MINYITTNMLLSQALFANTYGGTGTDVAHSIVQTTDGGYAVAGETWSFGVGGDLLVIKLASYGDLQWARTFGGTKWDYAHSIVQTSDGGYAVAGWTGSFGTGNDVLVLKLTSSGDLEWARTFGGSKTDSANSIVQTSDGGYAVAGYTESFDAVNGDALVLKLTSSGDLEWARTFGGTSLDAACSIVQTTDGGYAVAGETFGVEDYELLVFKLDYSGDLQWDNIYSLTVIMGGDLARSIVQTTDGGYAVAGTTINLGYGNENFFIIKLDSSGDRQWANSFVGSSTDNAYSMVQTSDGGYAIAGETWSFSGNQALLVLKLTIYGTLQWVRIFDGESSDCANSIAQTSDGGLVVTGYTESSGAGNNDFLVLKIGSDGNYTDCVTNWWLTSEWLSASPLSETLSISSSFSGADCSPTVGTPTLTITEACPPTVEENNVLPGNRITCSPFSGGIFFNSPADLGIKIYSVDGRVAYSGHLQRGENRITLGQGVYLWQAGEFRGKAAVR